VPGVLAVEVEGSPLQRPFVIMEHIDGPTLEAAFALADEARRVELVAMFVNLLVDLHGRGASVLTPRMTNTPSPLALVNREVYALRTWANTALLPAYLPVIEWLYAQRVDVPTSTPVITHRDFVPANVVLNARGMPHVLDWAWQVGDARFDLAWTLGALRRAGMPELADEVLAEYQRVTGGAVEGLRYFEVLAATRWLMATHMQLRDHLSYGREAQYSAALMSVLQPARDALAFVAQHTGLEGLPTADELLTA
jgi:aminoglycoside phosphotransferase (APT) family kinase protein